MPASADVISVSQPLDSLNGKHELSGSYEEVTAEGDVAVPSLSPSPGYVVQKTTRNVPWFASLPDRQQHSQFLKEAVDLMLEKAVFQATNRSNRVVEWRAPEELQKLIDLDLSADPVAHDKLLQLLKDVIQYSVKTGHPFFVNQLFSR
jgi:glutamate decarboxylase